MSPIHEPVVPLASEAALGRATQALQAATSLEDIMAIVRHAAREISGADGATFVLREGELCYYADEEAIQPLWKGRRFQMSVCVSGWVMLNRKAAIIPDIYRDSRVPIEAYRPTFVKSIVMVPIQAGAPVGAIGTYWAKINEPPVETVDSLQRLANAAAEALQRVGYRPN